MLRFLGCCRSTTVPDEENDVEHLLPAPDLKTWKPRSTSCCSACKVCCLGSILFVVVLALVSGLMSLLPGDCDYARRSFNVDHIIPANATAAGVPQPMEIGTAENMSLAAELGIDLTGLWWMDGNPLPEYLVSWAGSNASAPFPSRMSTPNNMAGRWCWSDSFLAHLIKSYYAFSATVDTSMYTKWYNSSYGAITPVTEEFGEDFHFEKLTENTWDRRPSYILRRVVFGNGTAHPEFWPKFTEFLKTQQADSMLIAWATNSDCQRKCQVVFSCRFCSLFC